jgi:hypothetical protein
MAAAAAAGDDAAQTTRCARLRSAVAAALGSGGLLPRSGPSPGPAVLPRTPCRAGGCGYSAAARCFSHARARGGGRSAFDPAHPWGFRSIKACHCTEGGLCPLYNDRFLLKTGTCRVPLPPPDPADPTAQELGIEMLVQAMQHNPELMRTSTKAERKELAEQTYRRHSRRTNRAAVYLAAAHFNDCDVEYEFVGGRWRATLKAETQHADARRNLHKKKFKQPMPSRPLKGNTLGDGLDQSVWSWSAQQAAVEGGRSSHRAPRPQFASRRSTRRSSRRRRRRRRRA